MRRLKKTLLVTVIALFVLVRGGQYYAQREAIQFGAIVLKAFAMMGTKEFGEPEKLQQFLNLEEIDCHARHVRYLSFLAPTYQRRLVEFKQALFYLSGQAALPDDKRFLSPPPAFKYFTITLPADHSAYGIASTVSDVYKQYMFGIAGS
jgi:hypothetical protein